MVGTLVPHDKRGPLRIRTKPRSFIPTISIAIESLEKRLVLSGLGSGLISHVAIVHQAGEHKVMGQSARDQSQHPCPLEISGASRSLHNGSSRVHVRTGSDDLARDGDITVIQQQSRRVQRSDVQELTFEKHAPRHSPVSSPNLETTHASQRQHSGLTSMSHAQRHGKHGGRHEVHRDLARDVVVERPQTERSPGVETEIETHVITSSRSNHPEQVGTDQNQSRSPASGPDTVESRQQVRAAPEAGSSSIPRSFRVKSDSQQAFSDLGENSVPNSAPVRAQAAAGLPDSAVVVETPFQPRSEELAVVVVVPSTHEESSKNVESPVESPVPERTRLNQYRTDASAFERDPEIAASPSYQIASQRHGEETAVDLVLSIPDESGRGLKLSHAWDSVAHAERTSPLTVAGAAMMAAIDSAMSDLGWMGPRIEIAYERFHSGNSSDETPDTTGRTWLDMTASVGVALVAAATGYRMLGRERMVRITKSLSARLNVARS